MIPCMLMTQFTAIHSVQKHKMQHPKNLSIPKLFMNVSFVHLNEIVDTLFSHNSAKFRAKIRYYTNFTKKTTHQHSSRQVQLKVDKNSAESLCWNYHILDYFDGC